MGRCSTQSGPFRCDRETDAKGVHPEECETTAPSTVKAGPAGDSARASFAFRQLLEAAVGVRLDALGASLDLRRSAREDDDDYRLRIWRAR